MAYEGIAKVQHYVPKFLLRNFGTGKKDKVHVFDKWHTKPFETNAKNVAAESRFYDFDVNELKLTIEPSLSRLEGQAKNLIAGILATDSLASLREEQRAVLCQFLAVQFIRTKWFRAQLRDLPSQLGQHLQNKHGPDVSLEGIAAYLRVPDDNDLALQTARFMQTRWREFALQFANKVWVLAGTDSGNPFVLGDHPITMQNQVDMGPMGNLGLAVPGIELYFPFSPRRALAMWCPTILDALASAQERGLLSPDGNKILSAAQHGVPLHYTTENVLNFNSLQIAQAERFVFSCSKDFSLVHRMLQRHPATRTGPRSSLG